MTEPKHTPKVPGHLRVKQVYALAKCFDDALAEADEQGLMDDLTDFYNTRIVVAACCLAKLNSLGYQLVRTASERIVNGAGEVVVTYDS